jgi:hypothetical protein
MTSTIHYRLLTALPIKQGFTGLWQLRRWLVYFWQVNRKTKQYGFNYEKSHSDTWRSIWIGPCGL